MTEIIPDTSKYEGLPNKLRAFALVLDGDPSLIEVIPNGPGAKWEHLGVHPFFLPGAAQNMAAGEVDYRLKPKPRELWAVYDETGARRAIYGSYDEADGPAPKGWTVVRFVEQP